MKILFVYNNNSRAGMAVQSETIRTRVLPEQQQKKNGEKVGGRKRVREKSLKMVWRRQWLSNTFTTC